MDGNRSIEDIQALLTDLLRKLDTLKVHL